jgi:hypothetical protein
VTGKESRPDEIKVSEQAAVSALTFQQNET